MISHLRTRQAKGSYSRLAVTTPWCVKLNQNILLVVKYNVIVVLGDNNCDWTILLLWDRLALDAWLKFTSDKVIDVFANALCGDLFGLGEWELLVLGNVLDRDGWPLADLEVEVTAMLSECFCVDCGKGDLALDLLCDVLELSGKLFALCLFLRENVE